MAATFIWIAPCYTKPSSPTCPHKLPSSAGRSSCPSSSSPRCSRCGGLPTTSPIPWCRRSKRCWSWTTSGLPGCSSPSTSDTLPWHCPRPFSPKSIPIRKASSSVWRFTQPVPYSSTPPPPCRATASFCFPSISLRSDWHSWRPPPAPTSCRWDRRRPPRVGSI